MLVYATEAELGAFTRDLPDDPDSYLRAASLLVADATKADRYDTDQAGKPTDPWDIHAFRDATCIHAAMWLKAGIDPAAGEAGLEAGVVSSSTAGSSVSYNVADEDAARRASLTCLCSQALKVLRLQGLATNVVGAH